MSQFFASGGWSIGVSASASVLPMNTQDWSPLGWTGWTSLQSKGLKNLLQHHSSKASILRCSAFFIVLLSHPYMTTRKTIDLRRFLNQNQIMTIKSKYSECPVAKSCPALWDPMECNPPGSSVHGILQARILEWVAMLAYRSSSRPRDWTCISFISRIGRRVPYYSATWEAKYSPANSKPDEPASEFNFNKNWDGSYVPLR